jgi:hypothetical protein
MAADLVLGEVDVADLHTSSAEDATDENNAEELRPTRSQDLNLETTELEQLRQNYSRLSKRRQTGATPKPVTLWQKLCYAVRTFWKHQVSVVVAHEYCRDYLGMLSIMRMSRLCASCMIKMVDFRVLLLVCALQAQGVPIVLLSSTLDWNVQVEIKSTSSTAHDLVSLVVVQALSLAVVLRVIVPDILKALADLYLT